MKPFSVVIIFTPHISKIPNLLMIWLLNQWKTQDGSLNEQQHCVRGESDRCVVHTCIFG